MKKLYKQILKKIYKALPKSVTQFYRKVRKYLVLGIVCFVLGLLLGALLF